MGPENHLGLEKFKVGDVSVPTFELAHVLDLAELEHHERSIAVALSMDEG